MKRRNGTLIVLVLLSLLSCVGGLPPSLQREIADENQKIETARHDLARLQSTVQQQAAQAPDFYNGTTEPAQWLTTLTTARANLDRAQNDARRLANLPRSRDEQAQAERLLFEERTLLQDSTQLSKSVQESAAHWQSLRNDQAAFLAHMHGEYQTIHTADLNSLAKTISQADKDWPGKASDLDHRLADLRAVQPAAETEWSSTATLRQQASTGKIAGAQAETLISTDSTLSSQAQTLTSEPAHLTSLCAQLYNSWDKILTDLDESHYGDDPLYRERLKTVTTHYLDVPTKKTETHSEEHWTTVSESSFHKVTNDLGMAVSHKDAGHYDSEAENTPQPPGYAYVASPEQGSNQYGYWTHNRGGESFWTFLPQYLILRELLWNHDYRPVAATDYGAYRMAQRAGTSYYGQRTPSAPPTYGSHGTFTQSHYAGSRYVQSGGFSGSSYASRGGAANSSSPHIAQAPSSSPSGMRFGRQPGAPPAGQRFGRPSGGFRPSGRGFGRRR
jgi:hypothetical protein